MKPILCVRNDPDDNLGITRQALDECGVALTRLDAFEPGVRWPALERFGGLIVFGGEMNADETQRFPYLEDQRRLMRHAVDAGVPVLGICLGAQLLARALDALVYQAPVRELGFRPIRLTAAGHRDRLCRVLADVPRLFQWHEDTFDVPPDAELLATGDEVPNQAFRFGTLAWGVQFHLEIDREGVEAWLAAAAATLEAVWHRRANEVRDELTLYLSAQQQRAREFFRAFAGLTAAG